MPDLKAAGLDTLYLFGSFARGDEAASSDIDLLFEARPDHRFSLLDQARLQHELGDLLGHRVDLLERSALRASIRGRVEADMIRMF